MLMGLWQCRCVSHQCLQSQQVPALHCSAWPLVLPVCPAGPWAAPAAPASSSAARAAYADSPTLPFGQLALFLAYRPTKFTSTSHYKHWLYQNTTTVLRCYSAEKEKKKACQVLTQQIKLTYSVWKAKDPICNVYISSCFLNLRTKYNYLMLIIMTLCNATETIDRVEGSRFLGNSPQIYTPLHLRHLKSGPQCLEKCSLPVNLTPLQSPGSPHHPHHSPVSRNGRKNSMRLKYNWKGKYAVQRLCPAIVWHCWSNKLVTENYSKRNMLPPNAPYIRMPACPRCWNLWEYGEYAEHAVNWTICIIETFSGEYYYIFHRNAPVKAV